MNITFEKSAVRNLRLGLPETSAETDESLKFNYEPMFSTDKRNKFLVSYSLEVVGHGSSLSLDYDAFFTADQDIDDKDYTSTFFSVNAPAIGYPFLRAYVANLLLSSGYPVVMLPTVNFVEVEKQRTSKSGLGEKLENN